MQIHIQAEVANVSKIGLLLITKSANWCLLESYHLADLEINRLFAELNAKILVLCRNVFVK